MDNIDLAVTRLADKLQGAVTMDIYAAASEALNAAQTNITRRAEATGATYENQCTFCQKFGGMWALVGLGLAALFFLR